MEERNNLKDEINVAEDKVRLTLKYYSDYKGYIGKATTALTFFLSFFVTLFTADFKDFLGMNSDTIRGIFIALSAILFLFFVYFSIKFISLKVRGYGDEEWFVLELKGEKKVKKVRNFSLSDIDFKGCLGYFLFFLLYTAPILVWIFIVSMTGWDICFSRSTNGDMPNWLITLLVSGFGFFVCYFYLIAFLSEIKEWFYYTFDI